VSHLREMSSPQPAWRRRPAHAVQQSFKRAWSFGAGEWVREAGDRLGGPSSSGRSLKIIVYGASGMAGSRIIAEALSRGHEVTAVSLDGSNPDMPGLTVVAADATDVETVAALAAGHDVAVSAMAPPRDGSDPIKPFLALNKHLVAGLAKAGVPRLVTIGGAGTLQVEPGMDLVDQPGFPAAYKGEALAHREVLAFYRTVADLDWTCISPAVEFGPGERIGGYRTALDDLIADADGDSRISAEDYAIAVLDEIENPAHSRERFAVAY